jgi:hypothetical protein
LSLEGCCGRFEIEVAVLNRIQATRGILVLYSAHGISQRICGGEYSTVTKQMHWLTNSRTSRVKPRVRDYEAFLNFGEIDVSMSDRRPRKASGRIVSPDCECLAAVTGSCTLYR